MKRVFLGTCLCFVLLFGETKHAKGDLNISKGQVLFLQFNKQGLKDIKIKSNLKKEKKQKFFVHPTKENRVILMFSSAYKKPVRRAQVTDFYQD